MRSKTINLRAHHLVALCSYNIFKKMNPQGLEKYFDTFYTKDFLKHISNIFDKELNDDCDVRLTDSLDNICSKCPYKDDYKTGKRIAY